MMQLNITTDYAIRTILYLAIRKEKTAAHDIADAMGIPRGYILKITKKLADAGLIHAVMGAHGGFTLAKREEEIRLYDIVTLMEPTSQINRCLEDDAYCSRFAAKDCPVRAFYQTLQKDLEDKMKNMTVASLLGRK